MEFKLRNYQILKVKNSLKRDKLFIFLNGSKLNSKNRISIEQTLKQLELLYYKLNNKASRQSLKNSIYKNINQIISGLLFIITVKKDKNIFMQDIFKLNSDFIILALKINNKIHTIIQTKNLNSINYISKIKKLHKILKLHDRHL
jgi:hypothetical protein